MRFHGVNNNGEDLSSMYVDHDAQAFSFATDGPSLTRQEFADDCDINKIMENYEATGVISHVNRGQANYLDVSDVPDLASAIAQVETANAAFMSLPAVARREFDNDPVKFMDYVSTGGPEALEKLREWGLAPPAPTPTPAPAEPSPAPAAVPGATPGP